MKTNHLLRVLIGLLLLAPCYVMAQSSSTSEESKNNAAEDAKKKAAAEIILKDSTVILTYSDGNLTIDNPEKGSLYLYAEGKEGYKATYYLFTSYPYIHLSEKSKADNGEFMAVKGGKGIKDILSGSVATYKQGLKMKETKPYRCFFWDKEESQILLSIDANAKKTAKTILLVVRPELDDYALDYNIKHGEKTMTLDEFKDTLHNPENKNPLAGYTLLLKRSNRIVIDSISCISPLKKLRLNNEDDYHDTPLRDGLLEIPLDGIEVTPKSNNVEFRINYRMFDTDGKISSKDETLKLTLSWERKGFSIGSTGKIVIIVVLVLIVALFIRNNSSIKKIIIHWIDKRNTERDDNNGEDTDTNTNSIKELKKKIKERDKQLNTLNDKILIIEREKQELEREKNVEKNRADNAENNANAEAARQINAIRTKAESDVAEANRIKDEAISRANNAEENANRKAESKINELKQVYQNKLAEEENKTRLAIQEVEAEKERSRINLEEAKADITRERDEELNKRIDLAKRLKELISEIPDEAFRGVGAILKSGVESYFNNLAAIVELDLSLKMSLDEMREYSLVQLGIGSSCWMHNLGRIYSYMSVKKLRNLLEYEGVKTDTLSEAFHTLKTLLASQGIVVENCTLGFDSNKDPMTRKLFRLDMQIDRITNWLDGSNNVRHAIPNSGSTIYDIGTLAYYTYDETEIHQGKVMYYDE